MAGEMYDAVIVGAGHNGLVASWYLANAGLRVLVLERRDIVGGACVTEELWPGFSVPTCSYICYLLQSKVIEDMELPRHGFRVHHLEPGSFTPFPNGQHILTWDDDRKTAESIAAISPTDARAYPAYRAIRERMAALVQPFFLRSAPSLVELVEHANATGEEALLERLLFGSVSDMIKEHFQSPEVQGLVASAWDAGDPTLPGSVLSSIYPSVSLFTPNEYAGIVEGGMGGITQAMAKSARARGVEIRTEAEVSQILIDDGAARGVRLRSGGEIRAGIVLSNADPKRTFLQLIERDQLPGEFADSVERLQTRAAYFKFHAALDELPDFTRYLGEGYDPHALAQIKICPSLEYYAQSWDDAVHGRITNCPVMAVQIPSVYDRTLVPNGGHVMSIWVQYAPVLPAEGTWDDHRQRAGEVLIDTLAEYAPNIREAIRDWVIFTPADIERRVGLTDGNIRHIDMVASQMFASRPLPGWSDYATPVENLYLCGASTHPGGEVTGAPGHNAAHAVLARQQVATTR